VARKAYPGFGAWFSPPPTSRSGNPGAKTRKPAKNSLGTGRPRHLRNSFPPAVVPRNARLGFPTHGKAGRLNGGRGIFSTVPLALAVRPMAASPPSVKITATRQLESIFRIKMEPCAVPFDRNPPHWRYWFHMATFVLLIPARRICSIGPLATWPRLGSLVLAGFSATTGILHLLQVLPGQDVELLASVPNGCAHVGTSAPAIAGLPAR